MSIVPNKIAFYLENKLIPNIDLSRPELGNPGCGGTEFLFVALPYYITKSTDCQYKPILIANHVANLPSDIPHLHAKDVIDAVHKAKEEGCSIFIYRPRRHPETELLETIDKLKIATVAWAHITPTAPHLRMIAQTEYIKALVCVEKEQHDLAMDSAVWRKLTYIVNGFDVNSFKMPALLEKNTNLVVYLGALVPQKGFHILAKAWPKILKRNPRATLYVIGSSSLYNSNVQLGPLGVADSHYEHNYILPFLTDKFGRLHPSVKFLGRLGIEKKRILHEAIVGVPNPGGQTENCPGSAIEFQACGTAVVSGAYYGLLDTVLDGKTGLLGRSESDLVDNICKLLENPNQAKRLGKHGINFIETKYNFSKVIKDWENLFFRIKHGKLPKHYFFKKNLHRHHKILILINRYLQIVLGRFYSWPSIIEVKEYLMAVKQRVNFKNGNQ